MRVVSRLYLVFGVLFASLLAVGAVALGSVQSWRDALGALSALREQKLAAHRLRGDVLQQMKEMFEHLLIGDLDAEAEVRTLQQRVDQRLDELRADAPHSAEEAALIRELEAANDAIVAAATRLFRDMAAERFESAHDVMEEELDAQLFPRQLEKIEALNALYRRELEEANERTLAANHLLRALLGTILLLVLGAGVILLRGLQRWLVRPLGEISHSIAVIGAGNLDHQVPVAAPDELGLIAANINGMAAALRASQVRLVESQRLAAVGELSSYIAHTIRNPLAGMRSVAQLGLAEAGDEQASRKVLHDIIGAVDRLEAWVRQLLVYSAPLDLARVPRDINGMLRDVLALLQTTLEAKQLRLDLDLTPALPELPLDEQHLEQAFAAIVGNAVDACRPGGRVRVSTRRTDVGVGIVVADDGDGMPPEVLQKAFQPYFTTKPVGVGLGLAMARRIVEAHAGNIEIASAVGTGTTVAIRLPG